MWNSYLQLLTIMYKKLNIQNWHLRTLNQHLKDWIGKVEISGLFLYIEQRH